jgi:hypothetical protein
VQLEGCTTQNLGDVANNVPATGQTLVWNGTQYVPLDPVLNCADLNDVSITCLDDVSAAAPVVGDTLVWDGTNWVNAAVGGGGFSCLSLNTCSASDLSDFDATPFSGAQMVGDGSEWVVYTEDTWNPPVLNAPFTAVVGAEPGFRRDYAGNIHLRGQVNRNAAADGATLFTLPSGGYRPEQTHRLVIDTTPITTSTARLVVLATGEVQVQVKTGAPTVYSLSTSFTQFGGT